MKRFLLGSLLCVPFVGCGPADPSAACTADAYPGEGFTANAAAELALQTRFEALATRMDDAAGTVAPAPTAAELEALFAEGTPSVRAITTEPARAALSELFPEIERAAGGTWAPAEPPVGHGGVWVKYLFTARGVDLGETVEKIVFSGAHFAEAARLMTDTATTADVDRMLALFGASPAFPMDDKAASNPDLFSAKYAKRRTNPTAETPGPYLAIKAAFITARASVQGGAACAAQRTQAFADIRDQWERTLLGTTIHYLNAAALTLEKAAPTEAEQVGALHQIGEGVGFLRGLRTLPAQHRKLTDAQLDQVLTTLGGASLAQSEAYRYVTSSASSVDRLTTAVSQIQAARAFTAEEIAAFKASY